MPKPLITVIEAPTSTQAWLKSARALLAATDRTIFNLVVATQDPIHLPTEDRAVVQEVDAFLTSYDQLPVVTVMNTIIPGGF